MKISKSKIRRLILERISLDYSDIYYKDNPDVLDIDDQSKFHQKIVTKTDYSADLKKSLSEWTKNEIKVLKNDLLRRSNIHMVIRELVERSGVTTLSGTNYSMLDVLSPYGKLKDDAYTDKIRNAIYSSYVSLLRNFVSNIPRQNYSGFDEVIKQVANIIEGYGAEFSMSSIAGKISDAVSSAQRGFFGRIYDFFAGTEADELLDQSRKRSVQDLGTAIAFYYMRHRLGETIVDKYSALTTPEVLSGSEVKSRFTKSETFLVYLHKTAGSKAESAALATAQARKDYFRRVMDKREKEGSKGSLKNWFAVHYPYAYAKPSNVGYFKGVKKFLEAGKLDNTGQTKLSKDELATIAYPKSHKKLNDSIGLGQKGNQGNFPKIAVVLEGKITAIYSQDVYSSTFSDPGLGGKRTGAGFARYAGGKGTDYRKSLDQRSEFMIYDLEEYEQQILSKGGFPGRSGYNEAFLDNWRAAGIACNWAQLLRDSGKINIGGRGGRRNKLFTLNKDLRALLEVAKLRNLKIYDQDFKEYTYQALAKYFDSLVEKTANSMGIDIPRSMPNITTATASVRREEKRVYFKVMYQGQDVASLGDKQLTVNQAIQAFNHINNYYSKQGSPVRPKFFYGTEKSKNGKIMWNSFSPRSIKKAVIEEQFRKLLFNIEIL